MGAHEPGSGQPVHSSSPGRKTVTFVNVDKSGVSMSWKTALSVIGAIVVGAVAWTVFTASLATKADANIHNLSPRAHPVDLDDNTNTPEIPVSEVAKAVVQKDELQDARLTAVEEKTQVNEKIIVTVKNGFVEQRAEDVAHKRVEKMPSSTPYRRKKAEFDRVKNRVVKNLEKDKDIYDGLEDLL